MGGEWWRSAVIYQIAPRSFQDGNGDGMGDLAGISARLDYVASLGVDAVWITPFFASPMADFGYDVADYRAVDPLFGTMADFDRLLDKAHGLGLKIIIDMVWSHSSDAHPWFAHSRNRGDKADWYVWADPKPDGSPPNNWLAVFGGPAWSWEPRRRQYYLHHFLPSQPALNWRNPELAEALLAAGRFWLDKGVDGFRLDAVDFMLHDGALRDNPPRPGPVPAKPFGMQDHVHDMVQPEALDVLARIRALMIEYPGTITMAELSSTGDPVARAGAYTGGAHMHLAYSLGLMRRPFTPAALTAIIAQVATAQGRLAWAFENHDVERSVSRWGDGSPDCAAMMLALLLALEGGLCLYQGQELGLPEADLPRDRLRDPYGMAFWPEFKGRDGCRTPMPWRHDAPHAGFSSVEPWLPVADSHYELAVDVQEQDGASPLNTLRRLLRWRKRHSALLDGDTQLVDMGPQVVAFRRGGTMLCVFNPSANPVRLALPAMPAEGVGYRMDGTELVFDSWGAAFIPVG
ncbi:MAG: alpha glucosidase [Rhodospirillaceae bacterium]|nr:alpha glucosidase [Rhodospirillales bacterium]